jgi:short-subunit dehydrogenase
MSTGTVVITGASAGVGRAAARRFAQEGWDVGLVARGQDGLDTAAGEVEETGRRALTVAADVADFEALRKAGHAVEDALGPIDVWVGNAMATVFSPIADLEPDEVRRATEVTYLGQVHGALVALELMRPRDRGTIVAVGSALAFRAIPLQAPYCAAKFATRGFMEALRTELLHDGSGIRVAQVHLPAMNTPQFGWCRNKLPHHPQPVAPIYTPEKAAAAIFRSAADGRRQRIVGSWNRMLVIANKVAPGVLDHFAAATSWDGQQLADEPGTGFDNLDSPVDGAPGTDRGAHGRFGRRDGGVLDPSFLSTLPGVAGDVGRAVVARFRERTGGTDR